MTVTDTNPAGGVDISGLSMSTTRSSSTPNSRHLPHGRKRARSPSTSSRPPVTVDLSHVESTRPCAAMSATAEAAAISARADRSLASARPTVGSAQIAYSACACRPSLPPAERHRTAAGSCWAVDCSKTLSSPRRPLPHDAPPSGRATSSPPAPNSTSRTHRYLLRCWPAVTRSAPPYSTPSLPGPTCIIADALTTEHIDLIGSVIAEISNELAEAAGHP
jgi:hypothetical protein